MRLIAEGGPKDVTVIWSHIRWSYEALVIALSWEAGASYCSREMAAIYPEDLLCVMPIKWDTGWNGSWRSEDRGYQLALLR